MPLLPWRLKHSKVKEQQLQSVPYDTLVCNDQPKDLWDRAHKLLREDKRNKHLVIAYERILVSELNLVASPVASADWGSRERSRQVSDLIAKKLRVIEDTRWRFHLGKETVEVKAQVDKVVRTVIWAQGFVSSALSAEPHSALAWAGVSLLLPLLLNPTSQNKALVDGLEYISTLIARFTVIEGIYRQHVSTRSTASGPIDMTDLGHSFELQVTKLYSQILSYQARVVCQLPRNALVQYGRDVLKVDDWSTMLGEMKTTEFSCSEISKVLDTKRVDADWKEQKSRMHELFHSYEEHRRSLEQTNDQMAVALRQGIEEQRDWHRSKEEVECLQALCTSTYVDHKKRNPDRVPGTCQWLLSNEKFHDWAESDSSELLWVTADPGCGKSVLSKSLVDCELQSTLSLTTAYYFFKDDSPEQRSATHALSALVHQLCSQNRALLRKAVDAYHENGGKLTLSLAWMWHLLLTVSQHPEAGEIVCIVDALDECQEKDKDIFVQSLNDFYASQKVSKSQIKFLVTSRPYYDIEECFDRNTIRLAGEDESESIKHEIDLVIKDRVPKIASKKNLDCKTVAALQDRLLQTENRTYLWLHLTLDGVEKGFGLATPQKMRVFIDELPRTINQAYEAMLLGSPEPELARKLLHIILAAVRPLTLREMNMVLNIERGQKSREEVDLYPEDSFRTYVKNLCGLLVTVLDSKIFLLHQTVKGFLLPRVATARSIKHIDSGDVWKNSMDPEESNLILASRCLYYLLFTVFEERPHTFCWDEYACKLSSLCTMGDHGDFLHYTALHWVDHFRLAKEEQGLIEMWYSFCNTESRQFTMWYEIWFREQLKPSLTYCSPLTLASIFGHDAIVRQLLEQGVEVDCRNRSGITPLIYAATCGHQTVVSSLIKAGALLEAHDNKLMTPLAYAAKYGHENVVSSLIKAGAYLEARNYKLRTPLALAVKYEHESVVSSFIKAGASLEAHDNRLMTPLAYAVESGHETVMSSLIKAGASLEARNDKLMTPLALAAAYGHETVVSSLIQQGALLEAHDDLFRTPLAFAAEYGNEHVVRVLIKEGALLEAPDHSTDGPLILAACRGHGVVIKILLEAGASIEAKSSRDYTPLMEAACRGHHLAVKELLNSGAQKTARNRDGETALTLATSRGYSDVVELLSEPEGRSS